MRIPSGRCCARFAVSCALSLALAGCGGGNKLITNRNGYVESGTLELDSIPAASGDGAYVMGPGDILDIIFPFNTEFNQTAVPVRPDGRITVPLIGDVIAAGVTPAMLDSTITSRIQDLLIEPKVAVVLKEFANQVVYVLGEVEAPGGYKYDKGMTLLAALALGGGPTPRGVSNGVLVIRRAGPERIVGIQIDYGDIADGKRFDLNVPLQSGDIVLVPKSRIAKAQDFALMLGDILSRPAEVYLKGWQVANVKVMYDYYKKIGMW